ncbi:MAG: hypothetical protein WC609_03265 [Candidatus Paceibacterota bacterium]|jgi:hypothetical protein
MTRISKELLVTSPGTFNYLSESAYDYTKWNLGKGIIYNAGATAVEKYIAPCFDAIRPLEESTGFAVAQVFAYNFSPTYDYLFGIENLATAVATRRVHLWKINKKDGTRSWNGFITMTLLTATAHTVRDFKIDVKNESTGTVGVSGTAVTGSGTLFATNKVAVGARIGFGSNDPTQITTWYRIATRTSDTALVLNVTAGTIASGTSYVIQEFRPIYVATNATTTNGGIHYGKGISLEDFTVTGTTIPVAVATDDQKAMYWLKDASTQTNLVAAGAAADWSTTTPTTLDFYVLDLVSAGNYKVFKYNIRAPLTVASGNSVSAFLFATGNNAFTGTGSQLANLTLATANHGPQSGIPALYFISTTRFMAAPLSAIVISSTTWITNVIAEIPTGGITTYTVTGALASIEYIDEIDSFLLMTSSIYNYLTQFVSSGIAFDSVWGRNVSALEQSTKDDGCPKQYSINAVAGIAHNRDASARTYIVKQSTTVGIAVVYVMAAGTQWGGNNYLVSPEIVTPNVLHYYRAFINSVNRVGSEALGRPVEPVKLFIRSTNITSDITSGWTEVVEDNNISGFSGASSVQFKIEFKIFGDSCIPARVLGINLSYEDNTSDSHFSLSVEKSSATSKIFAWWFDNDFGTVVPPLTVKLYDADTGGLLLTDDTVLSANGLWEKTTDGTSWAPYDTVDRGNNTTWIRYTPSSLADNVKVEAYLQQS